MTDLAVDVIGLQPYDLAAVMVVVEEAGGKVTIKWNHTLDEVLGDKSGVTGMRSLIFSLAYARGSRSLRTSQLCTRGRDLILTRAFLDQCQSLLGLADLCDRAVELSARLIVLRTRNVFVFEQRLRTIPIQLRHVIPRLRVSHRRLGLRDFLWSTTGQ